MTEDLIARLEAVREGSRELDEAITALVLPGAAEEMRFAGITPNYSRSLDAALALVPTQWRWLLDKRPWGDQRLDGFRAEVYLPAHSYKSDRSDVPMHWGPTPALALCIAALKARAA